MGIEWLLVGALAVGVGVALWWRHRLAADVDRLRREVAIRESEVATARAEARQAGEASQALQERLVTLTGQVGGLSVSAERAGALAEALRYREADVARLQGDLAAATAETARRLGELEALRESAGTLHGEVAAGRLEVDRLRGEVGRHVAERARVDALLASARAQLQTCADELEAERTRARQLEGDARGLVEAATRTRAELEAQQALARERATEEARGHALLKSELEKVTAQLLEEKGGQLLSRSQAQLDGLIAPFRERLVAFEQKVEKTYDQDNRDRASLLQQLASLHETQTKLHREAEELSRALSHDSKAQGDWGEVTLQRVLDLAGLTEGIDYQTQVSATDDEGARRRPDVVLRLPDERAIVIDAKCSLRAFVAAQTAPSPEARAEALKAHLAALRQHVRELSDKSYQALLKQQTLDNVLLFVPSEPAFHAAIAADASLFDDAFARRIVIVSPTTLLPSLQLVAQIWRTAKQASNAQQIAQEAGRLLDKLAGFVRDVDGVGKALGDAQARYDDACKKLKTGRGNLIGRARRLEALGATPKRESSEALAEADVEGALGRPSLDAGEPGA